MTTGIAFRFLLALLLAPLLVPGAGGCGGGDNESMAKYREAMVRLSRLNFGNDGIIFRERGAAGITSEQDISEGKIEQWREDVEDGGGYVSVEDLPASFPDAFPAYEGAHLVLAIHRPSLGFIVLWDIDDPPSQVVDFYKRALSAFDEYVPVYSGGANSQVLQFDFQGTSSHVGVGKTAGRDTLVLWVPEY